MKILCFVLAVIAPISIFAAPATYVLQGLDEVAQFVGNGDQVIEATEFPELVFRQSLLAKKAHDFPLCDPGGTEASDYDVDRSGDLSLGELTCFFTNNSEQLLGQIEKKGTTREARVTAVRLDVAHVETAQEYARKTLNYKVRPVSFDFANHQNDALNAAYYPKNDEVNLDQLKRWKISRQLTDSLLTRNSKIERPFVFSFKEDDEKDSDTFVANGAIAVRTGQRDRLDSKRWLYESNTILSFDVDTSKDAFDNSISLANKFTWFVDPGGETIDEWVFEITPTYTTDRDFARDVVQSSVGVGWVSQKKWLGRPGYFTPASASFGTNGDARFFWQPKVSLTVGEVRDAAGNMGLAEQALDGTYTRISPRIDWSVYPMGLGPRWKATGSYTHLFDLEEGFDHGKAEVGLQYDIAEFIALTLSYSTGRNLITLEEEDVWLIGIGIQKGFE